MPPARREVTVRLAPEALERFRAAAKAARMPFSAYLRDVLEAALVDDEQPPNDRLALEVAELNRKLTALRSDFANAFEALLVTVTNGVRVDPAQARLWVDSRMGRVED